MADYGELIVNLRVCGESSCLNCKYLKQDENDCFVKFFGILQEAADAIEELSRDLERSREYEAFWEEEAKEASGKLQRWALAIAKVPRWISVDERLPEKWTWVLAESDGDMWVAFLDKCGIWCDEHGEVNFITHWMPLPQPPEEDV